MNEPIRVISAIRPKTSETFYRFKVHCGTAANDGRLEKPKVVGAAYLKSGQSTYTLRLWTFLNERFYLIQGKEDAARYLVMTREPNKNPDSRNKYFWNIVGNARVDTALGHMQIDFDLFPGPVFMNLFPESSPSSGSLPSPDLLEEAA